MIDTLIHKRNATGITLSNLFGAFPKDNLFMIGEEPLITESIREGYRNVYSLGYRDYNHRFPLGWILRMARAFKWIMISNPTSNRNSNKTGQVSKTLNLKGRKSFISKMICFFCIDLIFFRQTISKDLREWIVKSDPDYFYAVLSTRHSILFAQSLLRYFNKPLIVHIMDDWPSTIGNKCVFYQFWNRKINEEFNALLQKCHRRIAISELMAAEYEQRYGFRWEYFHNPIDIRFWSKSVRSKYDIEGEFTILYSGRVSTGISETMKTIAAIVEELNFPESKGIFLRIQSPAKPDWSDKYNYTVFTDYVEYEELPGLFASAGLLLLPYDFHGKGYHFIRLSMPTKVTEYMASGTPILIVAPAETALSQYAFKYKWGMLVSDIDKSKLKTELVRLIESRELRKELGQTALKFVRERHNLQNVQQSFMQIFES